MTGIRRLLSRRLQSRQLLGVTPGPYDFTLRRAMRVPMNDGVELITDLYTPVGEVSQLLPTVVIRSPYGRGSVITRAPALAREGFTVVVQSAAAPGDPREVRTPARRATRRDGHHRWVRRQSWFTGAVATFAPSYLGYTQWAVVGRMRREDPDRIVRLGDGTSVQPLALRLIMFW
ncbi:CocE/NonD family hydrolase [Streptomyces sp900116325]|uniref:CocE/NonD family hydrolase n=1 Tax=Streptomyces sp. 900116325 TaxID=3154295 RepID=UPI00339EC929